jgi:uncharacterized protein
MKLTLSRPKQFMLTIIAIIIIAMWIPIASAELNDDLITAVKIGDIEVVNKLIANGADVNVRDERGATALIIASMNGHAEVVTALLKKKGVKINAKDSAYGMTALMWASDNGYAEIVKALLANKSVKVNVKCDYNDVTALMAASIHGYTEIVSALLARGANVNAKRNDGVTPLIFAAKNGHAEVVAALLAKGANVNAKDNVFGWTALMRASQGDHAEVVNLLKNAGAKK